MTLPPTEGVDNDKKAGVPLALIIGVIVALIVIVVCAIVVFGLKNRWDRGTYEVNDDPELDADDMMWDSTGRVPAEVHHDTELTWEDPQVSAPTGRRPSVMTPPAYDDVRHGRVPDFPEPINIDDKSVTDSPRLSRGAAAAAAAAAADDVDSAEPPSPKPDTRYSIKLATPAMAQVPPPLPPKEYTPDDQSGRKSTDIGPLRRELLAHEDEIKRRHDDGEYMDPAPGPRGAAYLDVAPSGRPASYMEVGGQDKSGYLAVGPSGGRPASYMEVRGAADEKPVYLEVGGTPARPASYMDVGATPARSSSYMEVGPTPARPPSYHEAPGSRPLSRRSSIADSEGSTRTLNRPSSYIEGQPRPVSQHLDLGDEPV